MYGHISTSRQAFEEMADGYQRHHPWALHTERLPQVIGAWESSTHLDQEATRTRDSQLPNSHRSRSPEAINEAAIRVMAAKVTGAPEVKTTSGR